MAKPKCTPGRKRHSWQRYGGLKENPGVCGYGGGIKIVERCPHCECERITTTWDMTRNRRGTAVSYRVAS